jgi:hypothetical protein
MSPQASLLDRTLEDATAAYGVAGRTGDGQAIEK